MLMFNQVGEAISFDCTTRRLMFKWQLEANVTWKL